ncbi:MAG: hypothetical protein NXI03_11535 [Alphaproteobacteria bacterium]|nr:hypothetical protein [Alphaproteobacteria bacterium]
MGDLRSMPERYPGERAFRTLRRYAVMGLIALALLATVIALVDW